jgi:glutamate-1-semialdehyde aminotransferase
VIDKNKNAGAELSGVAPMFFITFTKGDPRTKRNRRNDFYTQMIRKGFFFAPHHHAYISYRHTEEDLDLTVRAMDESLSYVSEKYKG